MNRLFLAALAVLFTLPLACAAPAHVILSGDAPAVDLEKASVHSGICPNIEPTEINGQIDSDRDTVVDSIDNCKCTQNPDQTDVNNNGYGDVCDNEIPEFGWLPATILLGGCLGLLFYSRRR